MKMTKDSLQVVTSSIMAKKEKKKSKKKRFSFSSDLKTVVAKFGFICSCCSISPKIHNPEINSMRKDNLICFTRKFVFADE